MLQNGLAPLHMSSQGDHVDAARILLYHRAPVDEVSNQDLSFRGMFQCSMNKTKCFIDIILSD